MVKKLRIICIENVRQEEVLNWTKTKINLLLRIRKRQLLFMAEESKLGESETQSIY